ncbi:MAG: ABC transporter permease [Candidatus Odinarchaeota archaeon]
MLKNYFKIAFRSFYKQKLYSIINIACLVLGMSCFMLSIIYIIYELSFDRYHENANTIYRIARSSDTDYMGKKGSALTPPPLAPKMVEALPEVETATRLAVLRSALVNMDNKKFLETIYWADPETFNIFSLPFIKGNTNTALLNPRSVLLSERTAKKYFGNDNPIGKTLQIRNADDFVVTGIFKNIPKNSHFIMDIIAPFSTYYRYSNNDMTSWRDNSCYTYILLKNEKDKKDLAHKLPGFISKHLFEGIDADNSTKSRMSKRYFLQPLLNIHLHSHLRFELASNNYMKYLILNFSIAFFILFIAVINHINLSTAGADRRKKEIGIRKVIGAQKHHLIKQSLCESFLITFPSFCLSLFVIVMALPKFTELVERDFQINIFFDPVVLSSFFIIFIFVGFLSGIYPIFILTSFKPSNVLRDAKHVISQKLTFRNSLIVCQFSITILLIICTIVVSKQINFIFDKEMGFEREQIVVLYVRDQNARQNIETIKTELKRNSNIISVSSSGHFPILFTTNRNMRVPIAGEIIDVDMYVADIDYDFIDLFGLKIVEGRNFSKDFPSDKEGAYLLNEKAVEALGLKDPVGTRFLNGTIVGVVKDFHIHSLRNEIEPLYLALNPRLVRYVSIKISSSGIQETLYHIKEIMNEFSPQYPFQYQFFNEVFDYQYKTDQRLKYTLETFSFIAIIIAYLGLYGLVLLYTSRRIKEIAIRKVLGSSILGLVFNLSKTYLKWIIIANIIAWPTAFYFMSKWLYNFTYRIDLDLWPFVISAVFALGIGLITVSYITVKAALLNPVDSLKYE